MTAHVVGVNLPFLDDAAEPNAVFDTLLQPQQFYFGEICMPPLPKTGMGSRKHCPE